MGARSTTTDVAPATIDPPADVPVVAWKGFDANLQCRGYQFAVGQTYTHDGKVEACASGFHACENPLDVWSYYGLEVGNRFARVQLSGKLDRHNGDSKIAAEILTVETEVTLGEMIRAGVAATIAATAGQGDDPSGNDARIGSSGYGAQIGSSGYGARIGSSGYGAQIGSSGYGAQIGSSGYGAQIGSSGNGARIGSSGYGAQIGSSGDGAQVGSSGDDAQIGSSGYGARIDSSGERASIAAAGCGARAKAGANGVITLAWWDGKRPRHVTGYVGEGIEADRWYEVCDGKLVEVAA